MYTAPLPKAFICPLSASFRGQSIARSPPRLRRSGYVSESSNGAGKVIVYGCDGTVWETSDGIPNGQAELLGTWIGNKTNGPGQWSLAFTDSGTFELKGPGNEWCKGKYVCDGNLDPKQLNLYIKQSGNSEHVGQTSLVIYKIDASTLMCALSDPGVRTRPGSFTPEGSSTRILVFTKQQ